MRSVRKSISTLLQSQIRNKSFTVVWPDNALQFCVSEEDVFKNEHLMKDLASMADKKFVQEMKKVRNNKKKVEVTSQVKSTATRVKQEKQELTTTTALNDLKQSLMNSAPVKENQPLYFSYSDDKVKIAFETMLREYQEKILKNQQYAQQLKNKTDSQSRNQLVQLNSLLFGGSFTQQTNYVEVIDKRNSEMERQVHQTKLLIQKTQQEIVDKKSFKNTLTALQSFSEETGDMESVIEKTIAPAEEKVQVVEDKAKQPTEAAVVASEHEKIDGK